MSVHDPRCLHRRTANIHLGGGQTEFCPNGFGGGGGGGVSSKNFPGSIFSGGWGEVA